MSTQKDTVAFILERLGRPEAFSARAMFGEYALYADGKVVALICDDQLYVKILPESKELEAFCEKAPPYPGAKSYYLVEEGDVSKHTELGDILMQIAKALPARKKKVKRK